MRDDYFGDRAGVHARAVDGDLKRRSMSIKRLPPALITL
jgi:hypothetical protein